jgi:lysophospholipase L1-like esterase
MGLSLFLAMNTVFAVPVDPDHPSLHYWGRFDQSNPKKPRFDWPGISIRGVFTGGSLSIKLEGGENRFHIVINEQVIAPLIMSSGKTTYLIAENLGAGPHTFSITKRTEGFQGVTTFLGLELASDGILQTPPSRPIRKIQFIGDSYTVGYGNEGLTLTCSPNQIPFDNNALAYGPLTAAALNAEYSVQAISGLGMVHNYGDAKPLSDTNGPMYFDRILMNHETPVIDPTKWIPDAITVAFGTNDFSTAIKPSETQYGDAYKIFLKKLRGYYPHAVIVCVSYPVDSFQSGYVNKIVEDLTTTGFENLHALDMPSISQEELGCDWHPGLKAHQKYSTALINKLTPLLEQVDIREGSSRPHLKTEGRIRIAGAKQLLESANDQPDAVGRIVSP